MRWALLIIACGGGTAQQQPSTTPPPSIQTSTAGGGNAATIICEGECRRHARCDKAAPDCMSTCANIPLRQPAVWRVDWALEIAHCIDASTCEHDKDDECVLKTSFHSQTANACVAQEESPKEKMRCQILNGLTSDGEAQMASCLAKPDHGRCMPPFDWK